MFDLDSELVRRLEEIGTPRRLRRGERLILQGVRHGAVLYITAGTLRIVSCTEDGDEVVVAIRGPGELVGELSPLSSGSAGAGVVAREDGEILVINSQRFLDVVSRSPDHAFELLKKTIGMFNESEQRRIGWLTKPIPTRVVEELTSLAESSAFRGRPLHVTQAEVANLCGASRGSISQVLSRLREAGVVETERGRITVTDFAALRSVDPASLGS